MKRLIIILGICFVSCNYFETKKLTPHDIVNQELKTIDWTQVDTYPSFSSCDSISGREAKKQCFETTMLTHVNTFLEQQQIVVTEHINDTVMLHIQIDSIGNITVKRTDKSPNIEKAIPEIDSLLNESIGTLPKLYPAIKRGQHVTTSFVLPVNIVVK